MLPIHPPRLEHRQRGAGHSPRVRWIQPGKPSTGASTWITGLGATEKILYSQPSQIPLPPLEPEGQGRMPQRPALHSLQDQAERLWAVLSVSGLALHAWRPGCSTRILFFLLGNCWVGGGGHWDLVWTHLPWDRWGACGGGPLHGPWFPTFCWLALLPCSSLSF